MKKQLLILFFFVYSTGVEAQSWVYHPFPTDSAMWREHGGNVSCNCCDDYQFVIIGDTIIGSYTYHQLEKQGIQYSWPVNPSYWGCSGMVIYNNQFAYANYFGAFREDTISKKIYFVPSGETADTLLYDFDLAVGDTLPPTYNNYWPPASYPVNVVTSIDSVLVYGVYHKRFNISDAFLGTTEFVSLIEGVGSTFGLFGRLYPPFEEQQELLCFSKHDSLAYPMGPGGCVALIVGVDESSDKESIEVFPNPTSGLFQIKTEQEINSLEVLDVFGRRMLCSENNQTEINISEFENGIYFVRLIDLKGNAVVRKIVKQ